MRRSDLVDLVNLCQASVRELEQPLSHKTSWLLRSCELRKLSSGCLALQLRSLHTLYPFQVGEVVADYLEVNATRFGIELIDCDFTSPWFTRQVEIGLDFLDETTICFLRKLETCVIAESSRIGTWLKV